MRLNHLITWSALGAVEVALGQSLESVLLDNGFTTLASFLAGTAVLQFGQDLIVYAPTDAAFDENGGNVLARRSAEGWGYYIHETSKQKDSKTSSTTVSKTSATRSTRPPSTTTTSAILRRQDGGQDTEQCGVVLETWLDDPSLVNLGPGHNQTIIEKNVCGMSRPLVFTGLGASVKVTADDIPFDRGVIRPVSGVFTLPRTVSETLKFLGASRFLDALDASGLLTEVDDKTTITVLAPTDATFKRETDGLTTSEIEAVLKRHILVDDPTPAYSPSVQDGEVYRTLGGDGVVSSVVNDIISFGDAEVSASDAIVKNGVIHTINRVISADSLVPIAEPSPTITSAPSATSTGGGYATTSVVTAGADVLVAKTHSGWHALGFTLIVGLVAGMRFY